MGQPVGPIVKGQAV